jgi:hypothetical protein
MRTLRITTEKGWVECMKQIRSKWIATPKVVGLMHTGMLSDYLQDYSMPDY